MKCPRCGLFNLDCAIRCDCGYDFTKKAADKAFNRGATKGFTIGSIPMAIRLSVLLYAVSFLLPVNVEAEKPMLGLQIFAVTLFGAISPGDVLPRGYFMVVWAAT
jgi:hypothetical protein